MFFKHTRFAWMFLLVILLGCLTPGNKLPQDQIQGLDKAIHFVLFFCFAFCAYVGLIKQTQFPKMNFFALRYGTIISVILALGTEVLQHYFIPLRTFEVVDIIADLCGIGVALGAFTYVTKDLICGAKQNKPFC